MDTLHRKAIEGARGFLAEGDMDSFHGTVHIEAVVGNARVLAEELVPERADFIEVAAWWHDMGRVYVRDQHEELGAKLAAAYLREIGFPPEAQEDIYKAIACHRWDMRPETLDGEIIRDADKLDFINPDRWVEACSDGNLRHIDVVINLLPQLREHILHIDAAKRLYDERIEAFCQYILGAFALERLSTTDRHTLVSFVNC